MNIALGYRWFPTALGYHYERALQQLGHTVTYIGLPCDRRPGYASSTPVDQIVAALPQRPDLYLWIDPAGGYFPAGIEVLDIPTACYLVDVHLGHWRHQVARFFDAVFVAQKDYVPGFQRTVGHTQVSWLPLGAAPDVHYDHHLPRVYEVGFVGNISRAHRRTARARRLALIASRFHSNDMYAPYTPQQVGAVYSQSRIVFNTSIAGDVTMRIFEAAACGAMVLTDSATNGLSELFDLGREIVTFQDDDDLVAKIEYYLGHELERVSIADAGRQRATAQHLYTHRACTLVDAVQSPSFRHCAPMRTAGPQERAVARADVYTHMQMLDQLLDETRALGYNPIRRAVTILPCLARRLLL